MEGMQPSVRVASNGEHFQRMRWICLIPIALFMLVLTLNYIQTCSTRGRSFTVLRKGWGQTYQWEKGL